jgi:hypothetical protein
VSWFYFLQLITPKRQAAAIHFAVIKSVLRRNGQLPKRCIDVNGPQRIIDS